VKIAKGNGAVAVTVEDDGRGFDVDEAAVDALGLFEMRERAAAAGGTLEVESRVGEGTRVRATVPSVQAT
jgi:signal transduction histidine kinase